MTEFTVHSPETAPEASRPVLEKTMKSFGGMLLNPHGVMPESPALAEAYLALAKIFNQTSLTDMERRVVWLTINYENECTYCMAAHSVVASMGGVDDKKVQALRTRAPLSDPKLEALQRFTAHMVQARGWAEQGEIAALRAAGYTQQTILDVILGIGQKTLSNYTNHIARTPVDAPFQKAEWNASMQAGGDGKAAWTWRT
jgi:alkylhydroperoxidase family enzyme